MSHLLAAPDSSTTVALGKVSSRTCTVKWGHKAIRETVCNASCTARMKQAGLPTAPLGCSRRKRGDRGDREGRETRQQGGQGGRGGRGDRDGASQPGV